MDENKQENTQVSENKEDTSATSTNESEKESSVPSQEENKQESKGDAVDLNKKSEAPQSKEEDSKFAKERHERDIRKAKAAGDAEGYKRARIKSVGGKNPYTDTPIETNEDFEFYELQDEVKTNGGDPKNPWEVEKLRREKAEKARKEAEESKSEDEKRQSKADAEVKEYLAEGHTQQELQSYWNDSKFMDFAGDMLGLVPLKTIIAKFDKAYPKENATTKQQVANKVSNPGSSASLEEQGQKKSIKDMSRDEFKKFMEDVEKGKVKIE